MTKRLDLTGQRFGRWLVVEKTQERRRQQVVYICKCDCGSTGKVVAPDLTRRDSQSCGCLFKDILTTRNTKHGKAKRSNRHKVYGVWASMKQRCYDKNASNYAYYGGRGIEVCKEWRNSFVDFYAYATNLSSYIENSNLEIDRIEGDGHYEPGNIRWVTRTIQMNNTSHNYIIMINGQKYSLAQAVRKFGKAPYGTIKRRLYAGWSKRDAFLTPSGDKACH